MLELLLIQIRENRQEILLQNHLKKFYHELNHCSPLSEAGFKEFGRTWHSCTGCKLPYYNIRLGAPIKEWQSVIEEEIGYFQEAAVPFVWYVNEKETAQFQEMLSSQGFIDKGVFKGVIGSMDENSIPPSLPEAYSVELVQNETEMLFFHNFLCDRFEITGETREPLKRLHGQMQGRGMNHWMLKKEGSVVSILSTFIDGKVVSVWNHASAPGISEQILSQYALQQAKEKGCSIRLEYVSQERAIPATSEGFGGETKWSFHAWLHDK
jgi:hypothetical protein